MQNVTNLFSAVSKWVSDSFPVIRMVIIIIMVVLSLALIVVVLCQASTSDGMGAISGQNSETFYSKNKARSVDGIMKRITVVISIILAVLAVVFFVSLVIYSGS